jgi:hypothetical protein
MAFWEQAKLLMYCARPTGSNASESYDGVRMAEIV